MADFAAETGAHDAPHDTLRQVLTVATVIGLIVSAQLPQLTGTGRTIGEQSELTRTLLVPWAPAFVIWGPIFLGLLAYAVVQALPRNRARPIFRAIGWYLIAAMGLSVLWALAASYAPPVASSWLTALIFTPYTFAATQAMVRLNRDPAPLEGAERWLVTAPVGLFAGWVSLAVFINWEQVVVDRLGAPPLLAALVLLATALGWIVWSLFRAGGDRAYAAAPLWGLGFLALLHLGLDGGSPIIGVAALLGMAVVAWAAWRAGTS